MKTDVIDTSGELKETPSFFNNFSTDRFIYEDLGFTKEELTALNEKNFFLTNYDNYYLQRESEKVVNNAISNATGQRLELHSVLLYLRDTYPKLTPEGDDFMFFTHFKGIEFNKLRHSYLESEKIHPKEFLSLLLLANINSRDYQNEAKDRLKQNEEPSEVLVDIARRVLE